MTASPAELATLRAVARSLGMLRQEVVFVGGMIRGLLITDPGASLARPTDDVDVVASIATTSEYFVLADRLRALGFREDTSEGAPLCRWIVSGVVVDVMPDSADVLGFTNAWYPSALESSRWHSIGPEESERIRVVDGPHFLATKLQAFDGRGRGDVYHHDIEDVMAVIDGRAELALELATAREDVRDFVKTRLRAFLTDDTFMDALPGHLPGDAGGQARLPLLVRRLSELSMGP